MNWDRRSLRDLVTVSKGKKHAENDSSKGHRYIQIDDLHGSETLKYTIESGTECVESDILIAWDGANAGKVGVGLSGMIGSTLARLRPFSNSVNSRFLYWYLDSKFNLIKSQRTGATIPHVNGNALREMTIPLPPLDIQHQIADTLDKADALRRKDEELLRKYDELAQSIFYDMFGDPFKNTHNWPIKLMTELIEGDLQNGLYKPSTEYGSGCRILRIDSFYDGVVTGLDQLKRVNLQESELNKYKLKARDIVINRVNSREYLGKCGLIPEMDEPVVFESNMMRFKVDERTVNPVYLTRILSSSFVRKQILTRCKDAVNQSSINQQDVLSIEIPIPPVSLQDKFEATLRKCYELRGVTSAAPSQSLFNSFLTRFFSS